ncbi:MAG: CopD family protein [Steroidobacteraceae bacterium]
MSAPDILSVVFRAVSFVLLLQAAGIAIFIAMFGRRLSDSFTVIRRLGRILAFAAMVAVAGHFFLEGARMAGAMGGAIDPSMQMIALGSSTGAAFILRLFGLTLIAIGLREGIRTDAAGVTRLVGVVGAFLALAAFALTGHTSVSPHRAVLATLLILHLLVVAFWLGALAPLWLATIREPRARGAQIVAAFSAIAVWLVPCILFAGVGLTLLLVPGWSVFGQPYGKLLLTKGVLFAVPLAVGALNKWRFGPRIGRAGPEATSVFRRALAIEYILICAVLAVTAVMTTFYSPEPA